MHLCHERAYFVLLLDLLFLSCMPATERYASRPSEHHPQSDPVVENLTLRGSGQAVINPFLRDVIRRAHNNRLCQYPNYGITSGDGSSLWVTQVFIAMFQLPKQCKANYAKRSSSLLLQRLIVQTYFLNISTIPNAE